MELKLYTPKACISLQFLICKMKWGLLFFLLFIVDLPRVLAHESAYRFTHFTVENGLPSMETYSTVQDSKGYIWIATDAGLSRFDGYGFQNYTTKDGLSNNGIIDLKKDSKDKIWISSFSGLTYLEDGIFHPIPSTQQKYDPFKVNFEEDDLGKLFFVQERMAYTIGEDKKVSSYRKAPFNSIKNKYHFFKGLNNSFWVHAGKKMYQTKQQEVQDSFVIKYPISESTKFCGVAYKKYLIYTSDAGLVFTDLTLGKSRIINQSLKQIEYLSIYGEKLWLVDGKQGVLTFQLDQRGNLSNKQLILKDSPANSIMQDSEGNYWITTKGDGLFLLSANYEKIKLVTLRRGNTIPNLKSILVSDENIFLGCEKGALIQLKGNAVNSYDLPTSKKSKIPSVRDIKSLANNRLLLATVDGLLVWNGYRFNRLFTMNTNSIYLQDKQAVLTGTQSGVFEIDWNYLEQKIRANSGKFSKDDKLFNQLTTEPSEAVFKDKSGQYWCGSTINGLLSIKNGKTFYWKERSPVFASNVIDIIQLKDGTIVVATEGEGLLFIKEEEYLQINSTKGLSSDICNDMITDGQNIWVATNRGITGIKGFNFKEEKYQLDIYNHLDGLLTNEIRSIAKLGDHLFGATPTGMMRFDEKKINENVISPRLDITKVIINEKDTLIQNDYVLHSDENNIRINYVGLSFQHRENLLYQYMMKGIDKDWITTTSLETHYSNLPPGNYTFYVAAIGNNGLISDQIERISFDIKAHFFQTAFFKLIVAFALIGLAFGLTFLLYTAKRKNELQMMVDETTQILRNKVLDMEEVNEKLERSNKELAEFAHIASHDLKSPLRNVAGFVQLLERRGRERLNDADREYINLAVNGVKHMENVINDILSMSKVNQLDLQKDSVNLSEIVTEIIDDMQLEIDKNKAEVALLDDLPEVYFSATNAKQLFQNLISNALKYQDKAKPKVEIGYEQQNGHYRFFVKDNGIGIEPEYQTKIFQMFQRLHTQNNFSGTGIGLSICKKIVEHNKGKIWFESQPGHGTTFFFTLPRLN